jgi:Cu(I)/Ag(I) efflux system membrane fusion protein/cobalt-zinc-cadmium efflux system membrane fusion protein
MSGEPKKPALAPMTRGTRAFAMVFFFVLGAALAAFVVGNPLGLSFLPGGNGDAATAADPAERQAQTLYTCPMHPEVIEPEPGDCPICHMALVPVERDPSGGASGVIEIDPVQVQNIGVVSEAARVGEIARSSRTVGILDFDAARVSWVNTKYGGWIEKVHVTYVGQEVAEGDPLFEIYSPELVATQEEYLRSLDYRQSLAGSDRAEAREQAESLVRAARERLSYWDIGEEQIRQLETDGRAQRRLTVRSPAEGIVVEIMDDSLEGMAVEPGMDLYKIADLSRVWVHADVYESDLSWVREGQRATVFFPQDADRTARGEVLFLYPQLSAETRTLKVCISLPNPDLRLRPGMYADVVIHGPPVRDAVIIPDSAVLHSGERDLVFVDLGEGRFEPREVELGTRGGEHRVQVLRGVAPGEAVVIQAQFMLDSESRVREAVARFMRRQAGERSP